MFSSFKIREFSIFVFKIKVYELNSTAYNTLKSLLNYYKEKFMQVFM